MHKRMLRFHHLNRDKDQMIAQQETDINSRHQAINQLQSVIARQARADLEQNKVITMQAETIAALQAQLTRSPSMQQAMPQTMPASPQASCKVFL